MIHVIYNPIFLLNYLKKSMAQQTQRYVLNWSKMVTPHVKHLSFTREDGASFPFVAGQFITLHIKDPTNPSKILHRSYSIANIPHENNTIEIACAYVENGRATQLLFNLQPGETIEASGPYGLFVLKDEKPKRYILIATGTGVTPYRSMLAEIKKRLTEDPNLTIVVMLGVRHPSELLFGEDFIHCAKNYENFHFLANYSRYTDKADTLNLEAHESHGYVQDNFEKLQFDPASDLIYLCGNPNMIDDAFKRLTEQGFDRKAIRREKYLFAH